MDMVKPVERPGSYLALPDFLRLNWACTPITEAFGTPAYLVGSVLTRADFRDIDLRVILPDEQFARLVLGEPHRRLLNVAISDLLVAMARPPAPVDFQIQTMTEASEEPGMRNPMGMPR